MRLSTRTLIDIGFAIALLVLLVASAASYGGLGRLRSDERAVAASEQLLRRLDGIVSTLKDAESGQRGYLLTRQEPFLEPYRAAVATIGRDMASLDRLTGGSVAERAHMAELRALATAKLAIMDETVRLGRSGDFDAGIAIVRRGHGKELMDRIRRTATELVRVEERALARRRSDALRSARMTMWMIGVGSVLAFLVAGIARFGILRGLAAEERAGEALARGAGALRRLYEITSSTDGNDKFKNLLVLGCEHFGLSQGVVSRVRGEQWEVTVAHAPRGGVPAGTVLPLNGVYCSVTLSERDPVVIEHAGTSSWRNHPCYAATGVEAYLGAPVLVAGRREGTLCFMDDQPRTTPFAEGDLDFLRILAQWMGGELERRQAEATLSGREERYRSLVESASDLIYTTDAGGRLTYVNPPFLATTGYTEAELLGRSALSLVRADHRSQVLDFYREQWSAGQAVTYRRLPIVTRDEREIWLGQNWVLLTEGGEAVGAQVVARDITRQYETERMKDEFLSVVSHELRTPLTAIRGSLGLLASGKMGTLQASGQRMLEIAARNTDRLVRLINDLLDLEKMASGKDSLERRPVPAAELIAHAADVMRPMAGEAGVEIATSWTDAELWADPDRILQVLTNLLSNAIKYSPPGSTVQLRAEPVAGEVVFRVTDQGRGIPADKLEAVFERFEQVDSSDARDKGGTGLGLPIARKIAEQHDGRLWVESEWGKGSTFSLALPLPREFEAPTVDVAHPRVLVCDDDGGIAAVARELLEREGYRVTVARSGEGALDSARAHPPAAILLDMRMPGMGGAATLAALRADPATSGIPVVIFSVLSEREGSVGIADVAGWLTKPVEGTAIVDAVGRALAGDAPHRDVMIVEDDDGIASVMMELFQGHGVTTHHARTGAEAVEAAQRMRFELLVLDLGLPDTDGFAVIDWLRRHDILRRLPVLVYTARDVDDHDRERLGVPPGDVMTKSRVSLEEFEKRAVELLGRVIAPRRE
ncbi:MAG TPA: CHASE3 domain-containing protein [Longimicrobium sp.]|nr:CHASE3 domain-containing protein [Longimicrobium sp.]